MTPANERTERMTEVVTISPPQPLEGVGSSSGVVPVEVKWKVLNPEVNTMKSPSIVNSTSLSLPLEATDFMDNVSISSQLAQASYIEHLQKG